MEDTARPEMSRTDSNGTAPRVENSEKAKVPTAPAMPRTTRYKEKFLTMKERYEVVTAAHEKYERELASANEKIKRLQDECNLLLDAVDIAVPGQPSLLQYLAQDPVPPHYMTLSGPQYELPAVQPLPPPADVLPPQPPSRTHSQNSGSVPQTNGTNGHV
ncbi:hypothetical protein PsYK624_100020 [Phanerochaete sordida]|uniref:Uncharacterized protein n=1 Tax=Phanerochaete sordida TaxID=48140 RepID=A0A9P3LGJ1_9APHY|nr:hypothetical protein PsYK624_100020 [Phanerochaete sordida]